MISYVVTEGSTDAAILNEILKGIGLTDVVITSAGGKALTTSLARSLALSKQAPVAVVVDADTSDESIMRQQQAIFNDLTRGIGGSCRLFQAVPTLDQALFPTAKDLEETLSVGLTSAEKREFKSDRSEFLRRWKERLNRIQTRHDSLKVNSEKARKVLERPGLHGLIDYLEGNHAAPL
jgi:hypothetical protein